MNSDQVKPHSSYLPELDILRFFAFFAVFIHHSLPHSIESYQGKLAPLAEWIASSVIAGRFGVDLFFALSAFLITRLLIKESDKIGTIDAKSFYLRRILRIFPLYYFFIFLTIFVLPRSLAGEPLGFFHTIGYILFAANWSCVFFGLPDSSATALWSVSIEEQFYLAFPFLVMYLGVKRLNSLAVAFLIVAFTVRFVLFFSDASATAFACNTFSRLDPIAVGILMATLMCANRLKPVKTFSIKCLMLFLGIGGFIFVTKFFDWAGSGAFFLYPIGALSSGLIIWSFINYERKEMKKSNVLIYLGRISYGLYVFHLLAIRMALISFSYLSIAEKYFTVWKFVIGLTITIIMATISYILLEKPFLNMKKKFTYVESIPV